MFSHFIRAFLRIIVKNRLSFSIKALGLFVSLVTTVLITAYIYDEISYDTFHTDRNKIYRITTTSDFNGNENSYSRSPVPLTQRVSELKSVEAVARIFTRSVTVSIPNSEVKFNEPKVWFADSSVTKIFDFAILQGNLDYALLKPNSLILSEDAARKYFSGVNAVGQTLLFENRVLFTVDAVVKNYPKQSSLQFDFIVPFNSFYEFENPQNVSYLKSDWVYTSVFTFVKVNDHVTAQGINDDLKFINQGIPNERVRNNIVYKAQALGDIHLHSQFRGEQSTPRIVYVYVFAAIGFTLFLIAIVNYISLTSAEWSARQKELGVRRVMGSSKKQIAFQFVLESLIFSLLVLPLIIVAAYLIFPYFNNITQKELPLSYLWSWPVICAIVLAIILYITSTGIFLMLYSQKQKSSHRQTSWVLIFNLPPSLLFQGVLTFVISCFSLTAYRQLSFIENQSLGFQKQDMITVPLFSENFNSIIGQVTGDLRGRMNTFEEEVLKHSAIEAISCSAFRPGEGAISALTKTDSLDEADNVFLSLNSVDYDFLDTYKIKLLAGRNFSREFGTDHLQAFLINEEAVKVLGFNSPQEAIGKNIEAVGKPGSVIGVMENFHFEGLQNQIRPLLFEVAAWKFSTFSIRLNPSRTQEAIAVLSDAWQSIFPETVFKYQFLEDELARNYQFESSLFKLTQWVSTLTVILSLLGIYAAGFHYSIKKVKDLTMRKVLGATSGQLIQVFTKPFMKMLIISFIVALPVIWKVSDVWLSSFAYRTSLKIEDLLLVFGIAIVLVFLVLLQQLIKVIRLNPVKNLRTE